MNNVTNGTGGRGPGAIGAVGVDGAARSLRRGAARQCGQPKVRIPAAEPKTKNAAFRRRLKSLVEPMGIEPTTSALRTLRSPN